METPSGFEWDDAKAEMNAVKHGVRFEVAIAVFLDERHVVMDTTRPQDGEERRKVVGTIQGRAFTVVFVMRGGACRVISARRANTSEERAYGNR